MINQVKCFENESLLALETEINSFLETVNQGSLVDIKYSEVAISHQGYPMKHFSAMVIYHRKSDSKGWLNN